MCARVVASARYKMNALLKAVGSGVGVCGVRPKEKA
jgi:hypothetical protein